MGAGDGMGAGAEAALFTAYDLNPERLHAAADPEAMRKLATATSGQPLDPYDPGMLLELLERQAAMEAAPPRLGHAWTRGWVLALLGGWLGAEWLVRRAGEG